MAQQSSAGPNHLLIITGGQPHYMQNANITPHIAARIANHGLKWVQGFVGKHTRLRTRARYDTDRQASSQLRSMDQCELRGGWHPHRLQRPGRRHDSDALAGYGGQHRNLWEVHERISGLREELRRLFQRRPRSAPPGWDRFVVILAEDGDSTPREWLVNRHGEEWRPEWPRTDTALIRSELIDWVTAPEQLSAPWLALMTTQSPHDPYTASPEHATISMGCSSPTGAATTKPTCRTSPENSGLSRTSRTPGAWGMASLGTGMRASWKRFVTWMTP